MESKTGSSAAAAAAIGTVKPVHTIRLNTPADAVALRPAVPELKTLELALVGCSNMTTDVWNGEVCLIDVSSGRLVHHFTTYGGVSCVDWAGPDHSFLLIGGDDGAVNVWGLNDQILALQIEELNAAAASSASSASAAAAPAKATAAAAAKPAAKSKPAAATAGGKSDAKSGAAMSDLGGADAEEDEDDEAPGLKDVSPLSHICTLYDHSDIVSAVAACPAGPNEVLTASWDQTLKVWDIASAQYPVSTFERHSHQVWAAKWSLTEPNAFVSASRDKSVLFWDKRTASAATSQLPRLADAVSALCFDPLSPHQLITGSETGTVSVYDVRSTKNGPIASANVGGDSYIRSIDASALVSGRIAVTTDSPLLPVSVVQYKPATTTTGAASAGSLATVLSYRSHTDYARAVCWSRTGSLIAASWDRTVSIVAPVWSTP